MKVNAIGRILIGTALAAMIFSGLALATPSSGTSSTLVGPPATFEPFRVRRGALTAKGSGEDRKGDVRIKLATPLDADDEWSMRVEARQGLTIATQTITFQPGGQSGWHSHPGPVFIAVKEGTMTFYDENCKATVVSAGQGFLDVGADAHLARNESGSPATNVVTYFAPPYTTILRIDAPQPSTCRM